MNESRQTNDLADGRRPGVAADASPGGAAHAPPGRRRRLLRGLLALPPAIATTARVANAQPANPSGGPATSTVAPERVELRLPAIPPFSNARPGSGLPAGWHEQVLKNIKPNRVDLVQDRDAVVLRFTAQQSGSSVIHGFSPVVSLPAGMRLHWRWKTSGFPVGARFGDKGSDDFSARLYLIFDYPIEKVPAGQRWLLRLARSIYGDDVPLAVICYVWDRDAALDTLADSPYSSRVKMIVARSGEQPGVWFAERRDIASDFRRAFGAEFGPGMPPLKAVALAADTDQTGSALETWFGDISISN